MSKPFILTIDDDSDFNNLLKQVLKPLDLEVVTCTDVQEFTQRFKAKTPSLCIIDLNLDIALGAGYQLVEALRKTKGNDIPIIVISRRNSTHDLSLALEVGANDALSKPIDPPLLISKIKQHLNLEGKKNELTYFAISEIKQECHITFPIHISEIDEFGITVCSPHLITKGTTMNLSGPLFKDIFELDSMSMMINETSYSMELELFFGFCEFDYSNEDLSYRARQWILKNSKQ